MFCYDLLASADNFLFRFNCLLYLILERLAFWLPNIFISFGKRIHLSISFRSNFSSLHVTAGIEEPKEPEEHSVAQRLLEEDVEEATVDREKIIADSFAKVRTYWRPGGRRRRFGSISSKDSVDFWRFWRDCNRRPIAHCWNYKTLRKTLTRQKICGRFGGEI